MNAITILQTDDQLVLIGKHCEMQMMMERNHISLLLDINNNSREEFCQ